MRKTIFIALLTIACTQTAFSQHVRFGLTFSPQYTWMQSSNLDFGTDNMRVTNTGGKLGFDYGLLLDFMLDNNDRYAFGTGLIISHAGGNIKTETQDSTGTLLQTIDQNLKLQYIEVPLTFRLRTNEIGYLTYFGQFGLNLGIGIAKRVDQTYTPDPGNLSGVNLKLNNFIPLNLGLYISAGVEYSLSGNTSILIAPFFKNGFTNVINDKDGEKINLNNLGLRIGVLF